MPNAKRPTGPRKFEVVFRPLAEADLTGLYDYIADTGDLAAAEAYIDRIEAACIALQVFPERGLRREDLGAGLRILGLERRVAIAFKVDKKRRQVLIIRVFYGGRDYERVLLRDKGK